MYYCNEFDILNLQKNHLTTAKNRTAFTSNENVKLSPIPLRNQIFQSNKVIATSNGNYKTTISNNKKPIVIRKTQTPPGMASCKICGRHFTQERIKLHQEICETTSKKKRKIFDPVKQRLKGTEAEEMINKIKVSVKSTRVYF